MTLVFTQTDFQQMCGDMNALLAHEKRREAEHVAKMAAMDAAAQAIRECVSLCPVNKNGRFTDVASVVHGDVVHEYPTGAGGPLFGYLDKFTSQIIPVHSGVTPSTRPEAAQLLLDAMGIGAGTTHFTNSFNIWKIAHVSGAFPSLSFLFHPPSQHVKNCLGATLSYWARTTGKWGWAGDTGGVWQHRVHHWGARDNPGHYAHVDINRADNSAKSIEIANFQIYAGRPDEKRMRGVPYDSAATLIAAAAQ